MVCKLARQCGHYRDDSFTCKVMDGGPRNELGHAYCGILRNYEYLAKSGAVLVEA